MKIRFMSDLHMEFAPFEVPAMEEDKYNTTLVLAGDIMPLRKNDWVEEWLVPLFSQFKAVVYVPGNHEYYGGTFLKSWLDFVKDLKDYKNFYPMDIDADVIDGVRFVGATLWTNFFGDPAVKHLAGECMNDYRAIKHKDSRGYHKLRPSVTESHNFAAKHYIADVVYEPFDGPTVVVTHHGPSRKSIDPAFADSPLNGAYVNDMDNLLEAGGVDLWIHGHVHTSFDYRLGAGRVVSNPRGYDVLLAGPNEPNPNFDPYKYVEFCT